jgi:hypothetical protein
LAAIRTPKDQFSARLEIVENGLVELRELFGQLRSEVSATKNTYADAVKAGLPSGVASSSSAPTSQGTPVTHVRSISPSSSASHSHVPSSPHVIIDISNAEKRAAIVEEKPGAVRGRIDEALSDHEATKDIKCWGISRNPRDNNKFKVFFKDEQATRKVRECTDWMCGYLQGTRLQADQWYPVRVDSVFKGAVLEDMGSDKVKEGISKAIGEENGVHVHKIQWLSKPNPGKIHGSMVLYLAKREAAEKLVREVRVDIEGETAFARPYERRNGPRRCFKCHQFEHMAAACPSRVTICSRCAESAHTHQECHNDHVKCAGCGDLHSTFDPTCRIYKIACEKH